MDTDPQPSLLIPPYGGRLVDLVVAGEERDELVRKARDLPSLQLSARSLCDLELLATGAFSPLDRFMGKANYARVLEEMRLSDGTIFPIPIALPATVEGIHPGVEIALRDPKNEPTAIMLVQEAFRWDPTYEALRVCGTVDSRHPLVAEMASWGRWYLSGPLRVLKLPRRYDFTELRRTPAQARALLEGLGHPDVVAFLSRSPMHRAHEELTRRALDAVGGALLLHQAVGVTRPGDMEYYIRVRTFKAVVERYYDPRRTALGLLPLAMRLAGPRSALWHAIIHRNYGANHFIVGRDHAGAGRDSRGEPFYGPHQAQELLARHGAEIGVQMVPFDELAYLPEEERYAEVAAAPAGRRFFSLSGAALRDATLAGSDALPSWLVRPEVASILAESTPPRHRQGFCVWFTGLPSAGKSTTAEVLASMLMERGRAVTLLDGDVVRTHLSRGLGFSREDRDANILRIGFVAAELVRHHGAVLGAAVSPYDATRNQVREMVGGDRFILVFVDTPLEVCEQRDTKGLYARARRGEIRGFTGIDDPYEEAVAPEITLTTIDHSAEENARRIVSYLKDRGLLLEDGY